MPKYNDVIKGPPFHFKMKNSEKRQNSHRRNSEAGSANLCLTMKVAIASATLSGTSSCTAWPQAGRTCIWNLPTMRPIIEYHFVFVFVFTFEKTRWCTFISGRKFGNDVFRKKNEFFGRRKTFEFFFLCFWTCSWSMRARIEISSELLDESKRKNEREYF